MKIETKLIGRIQGEGYVIQNMDNIANDFQASHAELSDADAFFEISKNLIRQMDYNKRMAPNIDVEYRYVFRTFACHEDALVWIEKNESPF